jgi:polysaccharide export outer membrane protein
MYLWFYRCCCSAGGHLMLTRIATICMLVLTVLTATSEEARYKLRSGDTIDLNFVYVPDFNQTVTIQPDGYVTLRAVGDIRAGGLTLPEVKKLVESKYSVIMKEPDVSIEIKDFEKPFFLAQGEVQKPGKYDLRSDIKLSEAVAIAGGLNTSAKHSQVLLFRRGASGQIDVKEIDLKKVLHGKDLSTDVNIQAGDMVFVPKSRVSKLKEFATLTYFRFPIP